MTDDLISSFLDSEKFSPQGVGKVIDRPWTSYWPPRRGSELHLWLDREYPEALKWRFDPAKPFNRPWQEWTRKANSLGAPCRSLTLPPKSPEKVNSANRWDIEAEVSGEAEEQRDVAQKTAAAQVDKEIQDLGLVGITAKNFRYLSPESCYAHEKPFHSRLPFLDGVKRNNIVSQEYDNVSVYNICGHESRFTLATSGFTFLNLPVEDIKSWNEEAVRDIYLPLMESWLKEYFRSNFVHIYTYNFRCQDIEKTAAEPWIRPFMRAHCDVTANSSKSRLELHLPTKAHDIQQNSRYMFVGMWRPLSGPYQDCPLALCDYRTVSTRDLITADVVFPHYCDEGYELKYSPHHRWFYRQGMSVDDIILFKHFDSCPSEAQFCPHAAFNDQTAPVGTPNRSSVELRAIVVC